MTVQETATAVPVDLESLANPGAADAKGGCFDGRGQPVQG